ncbi:hypothetical protein AAMO2058_000707000 [Amorphochlora amoebiformis]|uniref:KIF-binding protein n=1 Tax=Amorphochlora amoebiformis TaxID=1561963 RepID=A0A7S0D479_9EUKA|mmetsp:Transcript_19142/g.30417  ORF Transcript_19142/g.30417 Transcript_19142/m.30417 type:complete len:545 (+) Transcript_19142:17-1651(+)
MAELRMLEEAKGMMKVVDPPEEPFKSKYRAREILKKILDASGDSTAAHDEEEAKKIVEGLFKKLGEKVPENTKLPNIDSKLPDQVKIILGRTHHLMAKNYTETEEGSRAKAHLTRAEKLLKPFGIKFAAEMVDVYNLAAMAASNRQEQTLAKEKLMSGMNLYKEAKAKGHTSKELEELHTLTLFYLAQVEGHLGDSVAAAKNLSLTLARQLAGEINPKDWVQNGISLAGFHINNHRYAQADHMLKASQKVLSTRWNDDKEDNEDKEEGQANIHRTWGALCLHRLRGEEPEGKWEDLFKSLELKTPKEYRRCLDYEDAKPVFLEGKKHLLTASKFFILDGFVTDHIKILQELSQLWKLLSVREKNLSRRAKMHKRRINLLRPVLHEINQAAYGQEYQQLADEVASSYVEIQDIKETLFPSLPEKERGKAIIKINSVARQALLYYRLFIRGFHKGFGADIPDKIDDYLQKPYLNARFFVARLYTRIIGDSTPTTCRLHQASLEEYKTIIQLVKKWNTKDFTAELNICKEMVELLPPKIANFQRMDE